MEITSHLIVCSLLTVMVIADNPYNTYHYANHPYVKYMGYHPHYVPTTTHKPPMDDMPHMDEMPHMDDMDAMMMDDDMDKEMMKEMDEKPMPPMKHPMPHHHRASYVMPHHTTYHTPAPAYHHPQPYTPHTPAYSHPMPYHHPMTYHAPAHAPHHAPAYAPHHAPAHPTPAYPHHEPMHHAPTYHHEPMHYAQPHHMAYHTPAPAYHHPQPYTPHHTTYHHQPHHTTYHTPAPAYHHPQPYTPHHAPHHMPHMMKDDMSEMKDEMMKDDMHMMEPMMEPEPVKAVATETPKYLGTFRQATHDVEGDIFLLDDHTLYIQGFSFDGQAPDVHFWSDGVAIPYYTRSNPHVSMMVGKYQKEDVVLMLPPEKPTIKDLHHFQVWCRQYGINFGEFSMDHAHV
jgi:hypothetical protein